MSDAKICPQCVILRQKVYNINFRAKNAKLYDYSTCTIIRFLLDLVQCFGSVSSEADKAFCCLSNAKQMNDNSVLLMVSRLLFPRVGFLSYTQYCVSDVFCRRAKKDVASLDSQIASNRRKMSKLRGFQRIAIPALKTKEAILIAARFGGKPFGDALCLKRACKTLHDCGKNERYRATKKKLHYLSISNSTLRRVEIIADRLDVLF